MIRSSHCRSASHAGSWYSGDRRQLDEELSGWLAAATPAGDADPSVCAIIGPHAGFSYSGPTAAFAYRRIVPSQFKRVFVLGPSHAWYLASCALPVASEYETPLGYLKVDTHVIAELKATKRFQTFELSRDEREHSMEMHLPYIAKVFGCANISIVPILVGSVNLAQEKLFGELLSPYIDDPTNFFVISSDFCHWGQRFQYQPTPTDQSPIHKHIEDLDHQGMERIAQLDTTAFSRYLEDTHNTICGRHPIAVLMHLMLGSQNKFKLEFVKYAQSNAVVAMSDSSVSYASAVVTRLQGE